MQRAPSPKRRTRRCRPSTGCSAPSGRCWPRSWTLLRRRRSAHRVRRPARRPRRTGRTRPVKVVTAFARMAAEFMERSSAIQHALATAAQAQAEAARVCWPRSARQRHTGQSKIVTALQARGAPPPRPRHSEAADIVYALLPPDMHKILTVEKGSVSTRPTQLPASQRT
jgi:hypothetical protein